MISEKDKLMDSIYKGTNDINYNQMNENPKELELDKLVDFHTGEYGHVFDVEDDSDMQELEEQIRTDGILEPIIVRLDKNGLYEKISGHRRTYVAKKIGLEKVPVTVVNISDEDAIKLMVHSNLSKRKNYKPSTLARAYKSYMEANKKQAGRKSTGDINEQLNVDEVRPHLEKDRTREEAGEKFNVSGTTVQEYIRLTNLIEPLLELLDDGKIKRMPAVNISFLPAEYQERVYLNILNKPRKLKLDLSNQIKKAYKEGLINSIDDIDEFFPMEEEKFKFIKEALEFKTKTFLNEKF